jgi:septum formation protein
MQKNKERSSGLILASKSPRRKYLLEQAGLTFSVHVSDIDEAAMIASSTGTGLTPKDYTMQLARAKAADVAEKFPESCVLGADTIVVSEEDILEKPESIVHARQMLTRLSGVSHFVYTGFAVVCKDRQHEHVDYVRTEVRFKPLSDAEITWYINTPEPYDKAGAYAIQGLGSCLVRAVKGSYTNVVGLPVCEVVGHLLSLGVINLGADGRIRQTDVNMQSVEKAG